MTAALNHDPDPEDPIGTCPLVQKAVLALEAAIEAASRRGGREPRSFAVIWVTDRDDDGFCGMLCSGDLSPEAVGFMAETLCDEAAELPLPGGMGRLQ